MPPTRSLKQGSTGMNKDRGMDMKANSNAPRTMTPHTPATGWDLEPDGLTPRQIERLVALARVYPWIEFVDSSDEWRHLEFLKWRYETGRIER